MKVTLADSIAASPIPPQSKLAVAVQRNQKCVEWEEDGLGWVSVIMGSLAFTLCHANGERELRGCG